MTNLEVGALVPDVAAMETLPVGAAVTIRGSKKLLTRHPDGWAAHEDHGARYPSQSKWWQGMQVISLPGLIYTGPMTGDKIESVEQVRALPDGTVLVKENEPLSRIDAVYLDNDGRRWRHLFKGGAVTDQGLWDSYLSKSPHLVESLPGGLFETPEQFAARFRDLAITGAERALSRHTSATNVLETLKVPFRPTVGLRVTNQYDRGALGKVGTRVYVGRPQDPESFALFEFDGGWKRVFGSPTAPDPVTAVAVVIDSVDGKIDPDEWFVKEPTPEDHHALALLRAKAWKVGFKEKQSQSWCDEFERVMLRGGLSAESAKVPLPMGAKIGEPVTAEVAAAQAVGSVFNVTREDGTLLAMFRRVPNSRNKAKTKRLWGAPDWKGGNYADKMIFTVEGDGTVAATTTIARVGSLTGKRWDLELAEAPVGTRIVGDANPRNAYVWQMVDPGSARPWGMVTTQVGQPGFEESGQNGAAYASDAFGSGWYYLRIGEAQ